MGRYLSRERALVNHSWWVGWVSRGGLPALAHLEAPSRKSFQHVFSADYRDNVSLRF